MDIVIVIGDFNVRYSNNSIRNSLIIKGTLIDIEEYDRRSYPPCILGGKPLRLSAKFFKEAKLYYYLPRK